MNSNAAPALRLLFAPLVALLLGAAAEPAAPKPNPLVWDAMEKTLEVKPGGDKATFEFNVTNTSDAPVEIRQIQPSCGCTVASMPSTPWILEAGAKGSFSAVLDYEGKTGKVSKLLHVYSTAGVQALSVTVDIPDTEEARRARNQQLAVMDRQAVFRGECANCHVVPTVGQKGEALFKTACGICHEAEHRATMVPDLRVAREPRDAAYWERWIADGKERSLMPAFGAKHGGPLTADQIASLVEYAMTRLPTAPGAN